MGNDFDRRAKFRLTLNIPEYPVAYGVAICCLIECLVLLPT